MNTLINVLGWIGAACMLGFSFTLWIPLALAGLTLLTIQTIDTKMWNLTVLNIASIVGFSLQLI